MRLGPLGEALSRANAPNRYPDLPQPENHAAQERSIVLIDEIDKAPRDVPNDLLNELENMEFEVPELQLTIRAHASVRPVLVITSNSERNLPDAFLRRCVFYHIPFPGEDPGIPDKERREAQREALQAIIRARLPTLQSNPKWLIDALEIFRQMRERGTVCKNVLAPRSS